MVGLGPEQIRQAGADSRHAIVVAQGRGQSLGITIGRGGAIEVSGGVETSRQLELQIDGLFSAPEVLREPTQGGQRPLVVGRRVGVRDTRHRLGGASEKVHRAVPDLAPQRVMGQSVDVLVEASRVEALDGLHDARVQRPAMLEEQAAVRHVVGERVLEGVFEVRPEPGLVEELGGQEVLEPAAHRLDELPRRREAQGEPRAGAHRGG